MGYPLIQGRPRRLPSLVQVEHEIALIHTPRAALGIYFLVQFQSTVQSLQQCCLPVLTALLFGHGVSVFECELERVVLHRDGDVSAPHALGEADAHLLEGQG